MSRATIRARLEAATPGPWTTQMTEDGDDPQWTVGSPTFPGSLAVVGSESTNAKPDAALIAHARQDLPALLAALNAAEMSLAHAEHFECEYVWCAEFRDALAALEALP